MKTDLYTKSVLTVIAICLSFQVFQDLELFPKAYANEPVTNSLNDLPALAPMDVRIVDISTYDALNVNLKEIDTYDQLKVNLVNIDCDDELDVNIDEVGGAWISHGGPIKITTD